jgi:hypothetical protein
VLPNEIVSCVRSTDKGEAVDGTGGHERRHGGATSAGHKVNRTRGQCLGECLHYNEAIEVLR